MSSGAHSAQAVVQSVSNGASRQMQMAARVARVSAIVAPSVALRDSKLTSSSAAAASNACIGDFDHIDNDDDDNTDNVVMNMDGVAECPSNNCNSATTAGDSLERLLDSKYYSFQDLAERKGWYSNSAQAYDDCRPKYPNDILDEALGFITGNSILEIGSGPGTATTSLAERGYQLTCLEPNADFCAIAQRQMMIRTTIMAAAAAAALPGTMWNHHHHHHHNKISSSLSLSSRVRIENVSFEEASTEGSNFDAIVAATSMHWIPADVAFPKAAKSLKEGGCLVLLWNMMLTPFSASDLEKIKQAHGHEFHSLLAWSNEEFQKEVANSVGDLMMTSGYFENLRTNETRQLVTYTATQYLGLLSTYSFYMRLTVEERSSLFDRIQKAIDEDLGGTIELSYLSLYHVATKKKTVDI